MGELPGSLRFEDQSPSGISSCGSIREGDTAEGVKTTKAGASTDKRPRGHWDPVRHGRRTEPDKQKRIIN